MNQVKLNRHKHEATGKGQGKTGMDLFAHWAKAKEKFCIYNYGYEIQVAVSAWNIFYFAYKMMGNKTEIAVFQKPCYYALASLLFQHMLL